MTHLTHTYRVMIRESHLDTFGHVNNATFLQLYEEARWDWITGNGYGLEQIREYQKGPVILNCEVSFRKELLLRQEIVIESKMVEYPGKIGKISQRMLRVDGTVCSEATFMVGLMDLKERKLIKATDKWLAALG